MNNVERFRVGEINVICTRIDRSLAFYRDVLGFRVVEEEGGAIRLALGDHSLLLLPFARATAPGGRYCERAEMSFDLLTTDLAQAAQHLASCDVAFEKPWKEGAKSLVIRDPDGLRIEVIGTHQATVADPLPPAPRR